MAFEELNMNNSEWEVYHNSDGIIDEYPSPENTFDVWSSVEDNKTPTTSKEKLDPEAVAGLVSTVATVGTQLVASTKNPTKQDLRNRCGRRPLLKKNRAEYDRCKEEFYKEIQGGGGFKSAEIPQQPIVVAPPQPTGMSTTAKIGIALGIVALGVGGYFLWKRSKK